MRRIEKQMCAHPHIRLGHGSKDTAHVCIVIDTSYIIMVPFNTSLNITGPGVFLNDIFLIEMLTSVMPQTALGRVILQCILSHTIRISYQSR